MRLRPRREPARRQLAHGDDHVRTACRAGGQKRAGVSQRRTGLGGAAGGCRARPPGRSSTARRASGPWKIRDELGASMLENFGVFRYPERDGASARRSIQGLRERYEHVVVEDKGDIFNTDLTQALELGSMLDLAWVMVQAGLAREESRGAHSRPSDFPERDDERFLRHSHHALGGRRARAPTRGGPHDEVAARGEELLVQVALKIWRYDAVEGRAGAAGVRGRRARGGDAPRLSSTSSRTRSTARSRTARAAG